MKSRVFLRLVSGVGIALLASIGTFVPLSSWAADCSMRVDQNSITLSPLTVVERKPEKIYLVVDTVCSEDVEGSASFTDNGTSLGTKSFSIKADGKAEDVWVNWTPTNPGEHTITVDVVPDNDNVGVFAAVHVSLPADVLKDTDGDGIPDKTDPDMDNDGLTNVQEAALGTDPLKMDTDGDGVDDSHDAYPLDPNRSKLPPPPPPRVVTAPAVTPPATAPTPLGTVKPRTSSVPPNTKNVTMAASPASAPSSTVDVSASSTILLATTTTPVVTSSAPEQWLVPSTATPTQIDPPPPAADPVNPVSAHILIGVAVVTALSGVAFFILSARS